MYQFIILFSLAGLYVLIIKNITIDRLSKIILNFFVGFWAFALVMSIINVSDFYPISDYTYAIMYLGVVSFVLGFLLTPLKKRMSYVLNNNNIDKQVIEISKNRIFQGIIIIACIYIYTLIVIYFHEIAYANTLGELRTAYYEGDLYGPEYKALDALFLKPLTILITPVFAYLLYFKRNWICLLLGFYLIGYESLSGGRFGYIRIFLAIIFVIFIIKNVYRTNKAKFVKFFLSITIILISTLIVVSNMRVAGSKGVIHNDGLELLIDHTVGYSSGAIAAFNYSIENNYLNKFGGYKNGALTFNSVIAMANLVTSRLGFTFETPLKKIVETKQEEYIYIGNNSSFNALYTANFYFYYDFGIIGIFVFPFFFGVVMRLLIKNLYKKNNFLALVVVSWAFYILFFSVVDFWLVSAYELLSLIIILILSRGVKKGGFAIC